MNTTPDHRRSGLSKGRIHALEKHLEAHVAMLEEELNLMFDSPVVIPSHTDYFKAVEDKICELAEYQGALDQIEHKFKE